MAASTVAVLCGGNAWDAWPGNFVGEFMILFGSFQVVPVLPLSLPLGWSLHLFIRWRC